MSYFVEIYTSNIGKYEASHIRRSSNFYPCQRRVIKRDSGAKTPNGYMGDRRLRQQVDDCNVETRSFIISLSQGYDFLNSSIRYRRTAHHGKPRNFDKMVDSV
jgi:hypothetical protein